MGDSKGSKKKRERGVEDCNQKPSSSRKGANEEGIDLFDADFSSDIKGIISALQQIKEKAQKDGQKKTEETIASVASDIKSMVDEAKSKLDKERQSFLKPLTKISKECEQCLKDEATKFQAVYDKFSKDKALHMKSFQSIFSKYEDEKEKLFTRYEQQRKKEKIMLADLDKSCRDKIAAADDSLKKKRQDDKSFSILRKSLGSFLGSSSDDDECPNEED